MKDVRQFDFQPLDFTHRAYLLALGLAREVGEDDVLELDPHGLAAYERPPDATDDLVMQVVTREGNAGAYTVMVAVPGATRLDPVAAQWLWATRTARETDVCGNGVLTAAAWCTHCGHHFEAGVRIGELRTIRRWCDRCKGRRARHNPQLLPCRAMDCDHWFRPAKAQQDYCSAACEQADRRRRRAAAEVNT